MEKVSILVNTGNSQIPITEWLQNIKHQDYPADKIEVIVADDHLKSIHSSLPSEYIYIGYDKSVSIGRKRQDLKDRASGDILVCMDEGDYYPPTRISHCVKQFRYHPNIDIAHTPTFFCLLPKAPDFVYESGSWRDSWKHSTFAFRKRYALGNHYDITKRVHEEKEFTRNYKIPCIELDPYQSIVVIIPFHNHHSKNAFNRLNIMKCEPSNRLIDKKSMIIYNHYR